MSERVTDLVAALENSLAEAKAAQQARRRAKDGAPDGWEHVGWIDEYGHLYSLALRTGVVATDRAVYAQPHTREGS